MDTTGALCLFGKVRSGVSGAHSCVSSKIHLGEQGNEADQLLLSRWSLWTMAHLIYVKCIQRKAVKDALT